MESRGFIFLKWAADGLLAHDLESGRLVISNGLLAHDLESGRLVFSNGLLMGC